MPDEELTVAAPAAQLIVHPLTGEALELLAPTDVIAEAIDAAKEDTQRLATYKRALQDEILRRMDHDRTYTAHLRGFKITGDGPRAPTYDGERLHRALKPLVAGGLISERALTAAVETVTEYKVKVNGVKALLKGADEALVAAVEGAQEQNLKPRGVRVSREG